MKLPYGSDETYNPLMMCRFLLMMWFLLCVGSSVAWAQKKRVNQDYTLTQADTVLALIPVPGEDLIFTDSLLTEYHQNGPFERFALVAPDSIRIILGQEDRLNAILSEITSQAYSRKELKAFPGLTTVIDPPELAFLQAECGQADLMLVPVQLSFRVVAGTTIGYSHFRLYDLNTGELVFDCPSSFNVNTTDALAVKNLALIMIRETAAFFQKKLLER